jgi:uncharacterized protein YdcH (DUF465 family)
MDARDEALVAKLIEQEPELKLLIENHREYEKKLDEMNRHPYLSTEEDLERKRIQKAKLAGKDRIERILAAHRA